MKQTFKVTKEEHINSVKKHLRLENLYMLEILNWCLPDTITLQGEAAEEEWKNEHAPNMTAKKIVEEYNLPKSTTNFTIHPPKHIEEINIPGCPVLQPHNCWETLDKVNELIKEHNKKL